MKEITDITPQGIYYIDDEGNSQFIDFKICYQNFLIDMQKQTGTNYADLPKRWKNIGFRYAFGKPPSITFFTVPPTDIGFVTSENLGKFEYRIRKIGYATINRE